MLSGGWDTPDHTAFRRQSFLINLLQHIVVLSIDACWTQSTSDQMLSTLHLAGEK